jgi:proline iminopeptidase
MHTSSRFAAILAVLLLAPGCAGHAPGAGPGSTAEARPADPRPGADHLRHGLQPGVHEVVVNGVRLWYRVAGRAPGDAPPVVFLHGGPGQGSAHFDALVGPRLEPSLRMVYLDQRGSGHSERPWTRSYSIDLLVEDIEALRRHLGVPQVALVGHSFGGLLGLEYAAKYPQHVSALVFAAGLWDAPMQCRLRLQRLGELRPEAHARVRGDTLTAQGARRSDCELEFQAFRTGEEREAYNLEIMFRDPAISTRIDSVNAAHGIRNTGELGGAIFAGGLLQYRFAAPERLTMPVLVIAGRHDGAAQPAGLQELARLLPNARFLEYENSGHFMYLDEPDRFARDLTQFLGSARR